MAIVDKFICESHIKKNAYDKMIASFVNVVGIIPERPEQAMAIDKLVANRKWKELRTALRELSNKGNVGTASMLARAYNVKEIGMAHILTENLEGSWYESHQMKDDPNWSSGVQNALQHVKGYIRQRRQEKAAEQKGGTSAEL